MGRLSEQASERSHEPVEYRGSAESRELQGERVGTPYLGLELYFLKCRG